MCDFEIMQHILQIPHTDKSGATILLKHNDNPRVHALCTTG